MKGRNVQMRFGSTGSKGLNTRVPPSYAELGASKPKAEREESLPTIIKCDKCQHSDGTLTKLAEGGYRHPGCYEK